MSIPSAASLASRPSGDFSPVAGLATPLNERRRDQLVNRLFGAIRLRKSDTVLECLALWPDVARQRLKGKMSVVEAVQLAMLGVNVSTEEDELMTVLRALLPHVDLKATDSRGASALMFAAQQGHLSMLELLLPHCDPLQPDGFGETALMNAVPTQRGVVPNCIPALLPVSQIEARDCVGRTALIMAGQNGSVDSVKLLLPGSLAANVVDLPDQEGLSAFDWAVRKKNEQCADLLGACGSVERARKLFEKVPADMDLPHTRAMVERATLGAELGPTTQAESASVGRSGVPKPRKSRL